jgi:Coenzyme PQQ synthesis protein D (PqqD)
MRLRIADDVVFRDLAGESVLLDLGTGTYFGLDAVGTRLWHLLKEQGSTAAAIATLQREYDVDERRLQQDVEVLISRLLAKGLLTTDAEQSPAAH